MHQTETGKTQRLASYAFQARSHREVLACDLLYRQLSSSVLLGREMPLINPRLVQVITRDAKGGEQGFEFQEYRLLPGANDVREHSPCVMIERMPQPPCTLFGPDKTPHLIELGGTPRLDAGGSGARTKSGEQGGVDVAKRGGFF